MVCLSLRPAMITVLPSTVLVMVLLCLNNGTLFVSRFLLLVGSAISLLCVENLIHRTYHEKSVSLLPVMLFGKASVLTTYEGFVIPSGLSQENELLLAKIDGLLNPYEEWLTANDSFIQKSNIKANIEVFGQHNAIQALQAIDPTIPMPTLEDRAEIGAKVILEI